VTVLSIPPLNKTAIFKKNLLCFKYFITPENNIFKRTLPAPWQSYTGCSIITANELAEEIIVNGSFPYGGYAKKNS
jgi:hypothetical protein